MLTHGSLFSGIGGFDLGFEKAGIKTLWQVEFDEFGQSILRKRFGVSLAGDIRTVAFEDLEKVGIISGGFPCEDVSHAGRRAGIEGERSGLWAYFAQGICALRPRYALMENVPGLLSGGLERVLADLAAIGYDAEWDCIPAASVGAPHLRARIWILAYPRGHRVASDGPIFAGRSKPDVCTWWDAEPDLARVADGTARKLDAVRVNAMGKMAVPQIAEWIGRRIAFDFYGPSGNQASGMTGSGSDEAPSQ